MIEGNTRLMIYRDFCKGVNGDDWKEIPALLYEGLTDIKKHEIRLQSHLVGPRDWDPYSKAKYLYELSEVMAYPINTIISMCGGNSNEIYKAIDAYKCMQNFYLPYTKKVGYDFDPREYSKFVEYQNTRIKKVVSDSQYTEADFAEWVAEGNVDKAQNVRLLPQILKSPEAKAVFLKKNITEAEKKLNIPDDAADKELDKIPFHILAEKLTEKLSTLPYKEYKAMQDCEDADSENKKAALITLASILNSIVTDISKND